MIPSDSDLFQACNRTELVQLCVQRGLTPPPYAPKDQLIACLLGDEEPPEDWENPVDSWRHALMGFLLDHWEVVRSQLDCPAKSGDPLACFQCADTQVISCIVSNPGNEHLISLKRKR